MFENLELSYIIETTNFLLVETLGDKVVSTRAPIVTLTCFHLDSPPVNLDVMRAIFARLLCIE